MILSNPFNQEQFYGFIKDFLPDFVKNEQTVDVGKSGFDKIVKLGESDSLATTIFVVKGTKSINSRVTLTNNSFKILKNYSIYRALVVYLNQDDSVWRLSLLSAVPTFDGSGKVVVRYSNPRRHSYILGTDVGIATARKYLYTKGKVEDFKDLENRFSVEAVNKDFYAEIAEHFYALVGKYGAEEEVLQRPLLRMPQRNTRLEDLQNYSVRLLGRIIFLWFLRQKNSHDGKPLLPHALLKIAQKADSSFLESSLEPLFFEVLNKPLATRSEKYKRGLYAEVPYLNGGLFHPSDGLAGDFYSSHSNNSKVEIPNKWFKGLFDTLETYNFTIDENLENDVDLSIDPEMLGRVFENLLAEINPQTGQVARKSTGSYYTPRAIVNFMVDEAIRGYLTIKTGIEENKLKALISISKQDDLEFPLSEEELHKIVEAVLELKILDPACGSGAFPIGILQKILWIVSQVDPDGTEYLDSSDFEGTSHWLTSSRIDYLRKRKIIRDVIFGADIQSVAVEIAKLRCFLTLIVDQEIDDNSPNRGVVPLPNLDFKFICADSLVPLDVSRQMHLGDDPDLEKKLKRIRQKYFTTFDETKKTKLRNEYESLVNQETLEFGESKRIKQLKSFKPLTSNNQASFLDLQTMFGLDGFPLIIGNPPYKVLSGEESKENLEKLRGIDSYFYSLGGRLNLYRIFIERSIQLLETNGVLSFIVPSTLIADKNTSGIRRMFRDTVFETVTQATTIFLYEKSKRIPNFELAVGLMSSELPPQNHVPLNWEEIERLFGQDLTLPLIKSKLELELIRKIKSETKKLSEITSCWEGEMNQTFQKEQMKNSDTGYLFVRGEHLSSYHIDLSTSSKDRRWFELREESPPSLVARLACQGVSNMGLKRRLMFAKVPKGVVLGNSLNYVDLPKEFDSNVLLALLNSSLMNWYFRKQSTNNNVNVYELNDLPIRNVKAKFQSKLIELVSNIHSITKKKNYQPGLSHLNEFDVVLKEIDRVIYELYDLTDDEVKVIEAY
jgi:Alw26I/Eco31I/Esp3I family type II restriction m6 adenine DNA methyltransferase